jgi:alpha-mannosidase
MRLEKAEDAMEEGRDVEPELEALRSEWGQRLAERLLARASGAEAGHLIVNPASFSRRVAAELDGIRTPLPAPAKATQPLGGGKAHVVVEVPAFGFAWLPNQVPPGTLVGMPKTPLAEERTLRTDIIEAEVDAKSGGLKALRDFRWRTNRVGQQLSFGPGSLMRAKEVRVTSTGPALGEIVSEGEIVDGQDNVIANFKQRFRVWRGKPWLELRIEIQPVTPLSGYPWHAHYASRFAWRDTAAYVYRCANLMASVSGHTRPETSEYLEIRGAFARTAILTGGLPFHQKHSQRMLDVLLAVEGERAQSFDLTLAVDMENPIHAAYDFLTPVLVMPTAKGPPHIGASGWLMHLDAENVLVTSVRPAADAANALLVRLTETGGMATQAQLRCPRNPRRAALVSDFGHEQGELMVTEDAVSLTFGPGETQRVRIEL